MKEAGKQKLKKTKHGSAYAKQLAAHNAIRSSVGTLRAVGPEAPLPFTFGLQGRLANALRLATNQALAAACVLLP